MNIIQKMVYDSGLTQEDMADKLNITRKTLYNYLKRPKNMSAEDINNLAKLLNRSPRNLFTLIINN